MKSSNLFKLAMLLLTVSALAISSCKKDKNSGSSDPSSLQQLSRDQEAVESATDESMNDVELVLSQNNLKSTERLLPCNATVDSTAVVNDTITIYITYDGLNCRKTRNRTGKVEIKKAVGTNWYMPGATVIVRHIDFTVTKVATNKSVTINSVKVHKNVTGGVLGQLGNTTTTIVHRTQGNVSVVFDDGTTRTWNVARQKTYTGTAPDNLFLTTDGFGEVEGYTNLLVWGVNRNGEQFFTRIIQPLVHRQACDWDPVSGIKKHDIPAKTKSATLTFGYDSNNQPVTGNDCPAKYKLDWVHNNQSGTVYLWL